MRHLHVFLMLALSALQPVANFMASNVLDAEFALLRCSLYFVTILAVNFLLFGLLKLLFRQRTWSLVLTVVLFQLLLTNNLTFNDWFSTKLPAYYRVSHFVIIDIVLFVLIPFIAFYLSKYKGFKQGLIAFLVAFTAVDISTVIYQGGIQASNQQAIASVASSQSIAMPNVYFIVPDMFIGPEMFKVLSGLEPTFVENLEAQGLRVLKNVYANAPVTGFSLPHVFQMSYLFDDITHVDAKKMNEFNDIKKGHNKLTQAFHSLGYKFVRYADGYVSFCNGMEDECIAKPTLYNLQDLTFFNRTAIPYVIYNFYNKLEKLPPKSISYPQAMDIEEFIEHLPKQANQPVFAMMHVCLPHPPLRFDENCQEYNGDIKYHYAPTQQEQFQIYAKQALCAGKKLARMVEAIKAKDPDAIIVVQADHGTHTQSQSFIPINDMSDNQIRESLNILSAYRLPKQCQSDLYDGMSPVNSFRLVLSCIKGEKPEFLPDRHFSIYYLKSQASHDGEFVEWFPSSNKMVTKN